MNLSTKEIFQNAKCDPDLASAINIDDLLIAIENDKNEHLDNKTLANIAEEKYAQLKKLHLGNEYTKELFSKLSEYRFIDEIYQLHKGKHVRWIRHGKSLDKRLDKESNTHLNNDLDKDLDKQSNNTQLDKVNQNQIKLTSGGIVVDIKFLDTGTHIMVLTKNPKCRCIQYNFDECITFQKLSTDEQLILAAFEYIQETH